MVNFIALFRADINFVFTPITILHQISSQTTVAAAGVKIRTS
jgi:hypothetical protein